MGQLTTVLLFIELLQKKYTNKLYNDSCSSFPGTFTKKNANMGQKRELTTKHSMFRATSLHQPRTFYTGAACDA